MTVLNSAKGLKILFVSILFGVVFFSYQIITSRRNLPERLHYKRDSTTDDSQCVILFYSNIYWMKPEEIFSGNYFSPAKDRTCILTSNHNFLPSINHYDALIFYHWNIYGWTFPSQKTRDPCQLYILLLTESPQMSYFKTKVSPYSHLFNLTMSYRLDADIWWAYGRIMDKKRNIHVAPSLNPHWRVLPDELSLSVAVNSNLTEIMAGKSKMMAWVVSNCDKESSERMELVESLQKFMQVDIYGKCGRECGKGCKDTLGDEYFFYFAAENSLAIDYVSEKPFSVLGKRLIPVVYGGADYSRFLPPKSYIDAQDFATTAELARFLVNLSKNTTEYLSYFWWMDHYGVVNDRHFSDLCSGLDEVKRRKNVQYYTDLDKWFNEGMWVNRTIQFS